MENFDTRRNPVEELAEEFRERLRRGENPDLTEYTTRHPELADQIRDLFPALVVMEQLRPARGDATGSFDGHEVVAEGLNLERLGDYRILRVIGRGGMGIVYEAEQVSLGRHVALKVLPSHALLDPRHLARFQREARAAGRLHHSNIVPVYGVGQENGLHYYVMQFIRGQGLDQVLTEVARFRPPVNGPARSGVAPDAPAGQVAQALLTGEFVRPVPGTLESAEGSAPPPLEVRPAAPATDLLSAPAARPAPLSGSARPYWQSVARIGLQVAEALAYANSQGILHRDIKPSNLLLDLKGTVWVTDFGLAKAATDENVTHTGDIVGTLRYMAPERFDGPGDARSDLYALGLTLYEMLALRPAFEETDRSRLLQQVLHEEPPRPRKLNAAVPRDLETIVLKAIAREPSHRYQTAAELADDLRRFLDDKPIRARRVSTAEALWRWCRRNRAVAALTTTVAGLLVAASVGATVAAVYYLQVADREQRLKTAAEQTAQREQQLKTEAEDARSRAETAATESRQRLVEQYVDKGMELVDAGDAFSALPWLAEALRLDQADPARAEVHRTRLAAVLHQCPSLLQLFRHPGPISAAAYGPDGRMVATAGYEGTAQVWDAETGRPVNGPLHHGEYLSQLAFSPNGRWLATASGDWLRAHGKGEAKVWEAATGRLVAGPFRHARDISSLRFSPDSRRLLTASWDKTARVWDIATGRAVILKHSSPVIRATFSPDGRRVATVFYDGTAQVWDAATGRALISPLKHSNPSPLFDVAFSPDGRWLATAGVDRTARMWDANTGESRGRPMSSDEIISGLAFSPDGQALATAEFDGTVRVWQAATGEPLTPRLRHAGWATAVAFSPDGRALLTASWDGTARLWDAATGEPLAPSVKHSSHVWTASFGPDGRRVLTASDDGVARLWDLTTLGRGAALGRLLPDVAAFSPGGQRAVSAEAAPRVWDLTAGEPRAPLQGHREALQGACFSRDGRRLVTIRQRNTNPVQMWGTSRGKKMASSLGSVLWGALTRLAETELQVWDAETGRPLGAPFLQGNYLYHVAFSPDGRRVVVVTGLFPGMPAGWEVRVWDTETGRPVTGPLPHDNLVMHAAFSADGNRLVTGGFDGAAHLWDVGTGKEVGPAIRARGYVTGVELSPDGRRLLVTSMGSVQLFDVATGEPAAPPLEHLVVGHATFSGDGTRVVTSGADGTARVWDAATGQPRTPPLPHGEPLLGAAFSPDGRRLVTVGKGLTARAWDVATGQPLTPRTPQSEAAARRALRPPTRNGPPRRFTITWELAMRLWDLTSAAGGSHQEDLVLQAHLLASHTLDVSGGLAPLKGDALRQAWDELRERNPNPPAPSAAEALAWHRRGADACVKAHRWEGALVHLNRLTEADPRSPRSWLDRGRVHAELGQWDQAAADYERATAAGAAEERVWRELALLQLARGDPAGYRRACAQTLDRFGQTTDPVTANNVAWACSLGPEACADPEQFVQLAERAVRGNRNWGYLNTLGAALYRAGRLDEAVRRLTEATKLQGPEGNALDCLFLALAHHQRGQDDRARACMTKADRLWKAERPASRSPPSWVERLEYQVLRREAAGSLDHRARPSPKTPTRE